MKKSCSNYLSILDRTAIALSSEGMVTVVDDRIKVKSSTTLHRVSVTLNSKHVLYCNVLYHILYCIVLSTGLCWC